MALISSCVALNSMVLQWNLSNTNPISGTKIIVLTSEVYLFQGENNMYLHKVGTHSSVLINQRVLISGVL